MKNDHRGARAAGRLTAKERQWVQQTRDGKAAVARGVAPEHIERSGKSTPVWDPASVRNATVEG